MTPFSNITYCTGITTSMKLQPKCTTCARYQATMFVGSEVVALWFVDKPALATDCELFKPKVVA
jgi:hypothetical protein